METSDFFFSSGRLWIQICWEETHGAPYYMHQNIIFLYQWIGLGDYIVELVRIGTINKDL